MQGKTVNGIDYTARARRRRDNAEKGTKKLFDSGDGDDERCQLAVHQSKTNRETTQHVTPVQRKRQVPPNSKVERALKAYRVPIETVSTR